MIFKTLDQTMEEGVSHDPQICKRVFLKNGELPHLTSFSQAIIRPGQVVSSHAHMDMYEVFYILQGIGLIIIGDMDYSFEPGCCVVVEPGEVHKIVNKGHIDILINYFGLKE